MSEEDPQSVTSDLIEPDQDTPGGHAATNKAKQDLRIALIQHISKEIEKATDLLSAQRTRNNLFTAVGPFLILAVLATNAILFERLKNVPSGILFAIFFVVVTLYLFLGWLSAKIEETIWDQCNAWRTRIAQLTGEAPGDLEFPRRYLTVVYLLIYACFSLLFGFLALLILYPIFWG